jgi:hypothetical protein
MTDTPKKPGRPRKATAQEPKVTPQVATTPQESPVQLSKSDSGTQVPDKPEIDTQSPTKGLPTISVEELVEGMDIALVQRVDAALARHMIKDHRMTWGEVRVSLGYGVQGQDDNVDAMWSRVHRMANDVR